MTETYVNGVCFRSPIKKAKFSCAVPQGDGVNFSSGGETLSRRVGFPSGLCGKDGASRLTKKAGVRYTRLGTSLAAGHQKLPYLSTFLMEYNSSQFFFVNRERAKTWQGLMQGAKSQSHDLGGTRRGTPSTITEDKISSL